MTTSPHQSNLDTKQQWVNFLVSQSTPVTSFLHFYALSVQENLEQDTRLFNCMFQADNHSIGFDYIPHNVTSLGSHQSPTTDKNMTDSRCYGVGVTEKW